MTTENVKCFDTMVFNMEGYAYVKRKSMNEENTQKAYYLVLGKFTKLLQSKLKQWTGWS